MGDGFWVHTLTIDGVAHVSSMGFVRIPSIGPMHTSWTGPYTHHRRCHAHRRHTRQRPHHRRGHAHTIDARRTAASHARCARWRGCAGERGWQQDVRPLDERKQDRYPCSDGPMIMGLPGTVGYGAAGTVGYGALWRQGRRSTRHLRSALEGTAVSRLMRGPHIGHNYMGLNYMGHYYRP